MKIKTRLTMVVVISLCACSDSNTDSDKVVEIDAEKPAKHILSDQEKMLQKAKDAEKLVKEADEKRRKALEDHGG